MPDNNDKLFEELEKKFDELFDIEDVDEEFDDEIMNNIIMLNDEDGNEVPFEFLDLILYEEKEYVVLLPVSDSDDAGEVVILKIEKTDNTDEETYTSVDNEETLMAVFNIFKEKFKEEFNFVD